VSLTGSSRAPVASRPPARAARARGARLAVLAFLALPGLALADCAPDRADIRGPWGQAQFTVEIADDAEERARGLMFREHLAPMAGMLFVYEAPTHARFWMKNTPIPLDMIFFDPAGTVTRVIANAEPFSLDARDGGPGVLLVLEIGGGMAARLGIGPGDALRHPAVARDGAAWPCP
jgi:uncharacterized protein